MTGNFCDGGGLTPVVGKLLLLETEKLLDFIEGASSLTGCILVNRAAAVKGVPEALHAARMREAGIRRVNIVDCKRQSSEYDAVRWEWLRNVWVNEERICTKDATERYKKVKA